MKHTLNALALGYAAAIMSALVMLTLGILANLGIYEEAAATMAQHHLIFSLSFLGIIGGMVEAAIISFITGYIFGWLYNRLAGKENK